MVGAIAPRLKAERQGHHGCREGRVGGLREPRDDAR